MAAQTSDRIYDGALALSAALMGTALVWALHVAPTERLMGVVQRIFYFHVPSAIAMGALFVVCGVASLAYLVRGDDRLDAIAATAAELAVTLGAVVLITGPLWARKAWGTWWTWEPRLTMTLLTVFLYVGYLATRAWAGEPAFARRAAAALGALGLPGYYFIKVAVQRWGGNHPKDVVYGKSEGLVNPDMATAFGLSLGAVALLVVLIFWARYRLRRLADRVDAARLELEQSV